MTKTLAAPSDKSPPNPAAEPEPEPSAQREGRLPTPPIARSALPPPNGLPREARGGRMLGSAELGVPGRARMSHALQRAVGNTRIARVGVDPNCPLCDHKATTVQAKLSGVAQPGRRGIDSGLESRIQAPASGRPLVPDLQRDMESGLKTDLSHVRVHDSSSDRADADRLNARAFTHGSHIWIGSTGSADDRKLMAHELTHVVQQSDAAPATPAIQRDDNPPTNIQQLDEMLDRWNVPEEDVIALLGRMSAAEKATVLAGYRDRIASPLNVSEMVRAVNNLGPPLEKKLEWVEAAATFRSQIDYSDIKGMVTSAPQPERDALKTDRWRGFFVDVCTDRTMVEAVTDLHFDLTTQLQWIRAEMSWPGLDYSDIKPLITAASQPDRDALKTDEWRDFFVDVCDNKTIIEAVNDLHFDLETKLKWVRAEVGWVSVELDYSDIKPLITAASQPERDVLKTDAWRDFFVDVCTNATMAEAVDDLGWDLSLKLKWMIEEGTNYSMVKTKITAASAGDRATALADQDLLGKLEDELSWNNFAKSVELLGRHAPSAGTMLGDGTVSGAMTASFTASNPAVTLPPNDPAQPVGPCNPAPGTPAPPGVHEEVGWIYMNLITGNLATRMAPSTGGQADGNLGSPTEMDHSIVVGAWHTHPNVGPCWGAVFASPEDIAAANNTGVPLLIIGAFPTVATHQTTSTGPTRAHLAGNRGFPGTTGGDAPQATIDRRHDAV